MDASGSTHANNQSDGQEQLPDHYAHHLAEVNHDNEVISTEDIVNHQGVLVAPKGTRINGEMAEHLEQHKLLKPLEIQIDLSEKIDGDQLFAHFKQVFHRFPDLDQIHQAERFEHDLEVYVVGHEIHPVLNQKLTVMQRQMPELFDKSLLVGWLAALIARRSGLHHDKVYAAYLAGLLHDLGLLHIPPKILNKEEALDAEEWRAVQSHVVVGHLALEKIPLLDPLVLRAVLEHHERCDGTGYPQGRLSSDLDLLGQIVGLADSLIAIRFHQFEQVGRNVANTMPYLNMNNLTYTHNAYRAACSIVKNSGVEPAAINTYGDLLALDSILLARQKVLAQVMEMVRSLVKIVQQCQQGGRIEALLRTTAQMLVMDASSGLLRRELASWLEGLQAHFKADAPKDGELLLELNEIDLMQGELQWQFKTVLRVLNEYLDQPHNSDAPLFGSMRGLAEDMRLAFQVLDR